MNKPSQSTRSRPPPQWLAVLLPLIAGFLHLRVFYLAIVHNLFRVLLNSSASESTTEEFRNECYLLDRAIFIAYVFDLACCYVKVIPFSRCGRSGDIVTHHVPTLILALPLAIPLWADLRSFESASFSVLDLSIGDDVRSRFIDSYTLASGFAYVSSLNEVFMCFQRVEMSLGGVTRFRDIPLMNKGGDDRYYYFFTSRFAIGAELAYKLFFFWGLSIVACKACCDFDKSLYDSIIIIAGTGGDQDQRQAIWKTLLTIYSSPAVLRGVLFRAFSVAMYPSMGGRVLKKIREFQQEGKSAKSV